MAKRIAAIETVPPRELRALRLDELPHATVALAKFLLGKVLVRDSKEGRVSGRIVETEAYPPGDPACHARSGRTARNASLFLRHGHIYVYRAYGTAMMLNVSSEAEGVGAGVLIRAAEPLTGIEVMRRRRGIDDVYRLTKGPGCLAQAFAVDLGLDGVAYDAANSLWLADDGFGVTKVGRSVRIGITRNADKPWRFFIHGNRWVSGPARLNDGAK
ncbi:MAG: DNA-3-methyladenine glycosylase [Hyphomicrobium sp.]|uniref:DNA-3-methyladenine glycosylase n=1 Tax=Hyphomicrobium sp. TaxID=82 RepID=UPI00132991C8|nr:DNA-3-methyladenine glycosylase [Hyphomicrobium sp.]KAB2940168.1 MAG: DNA-3-methyladenine glycosylase [Hyphomicrobium sp.]MBZ0210458.1 DNA-3-methyladenine glycosylase [Hyphomicrobium sp.]MCZ7595300.1 DNA-3-methyladenine glycosylase [Hyphomicrobium sp.]